MARGGRKGRPRAQPQPLEEKEQPPRNSPITIDRNNPELPPRAEEERNEIVQRRSENTPRPFSSYASMVDPNEGTPLDFVPISKINGYKCAKIVGKDIEEEIAYWQNTVVYCVLKANPPVEVIKGFVKRIWSAYAIDKVLLVKKGLYLVRFLEAQDAKTVAHNGLYHFDHKPFIVKPEILNWILIQTKLPPCQSGFNFQN